MATAVDPLRNTLDRLALDPAAQADRPYLVSMLRRLGYSEVEIQAYLQSQPSAPTPLPASRTAPTPAAPAAAAEETDRVIELEYTGPGLRDFIIITPVDATEFGLDNQDELGLADGLTAGEEVFDSGPSMEEVDRLVAEGNLSDFDDWGEGAEQPKEEVPIAADRGAEPLEGENPDLGPAGENPLELQASESSGESLELPEPSEPTEDFSSDPTKQPAGEEFVEFGAGPTEEFVEFGETPSDGLAGEGEGWQDAQMLEAPQSTEPGAPYRYEDWTLYSRDVELPTGKAQRIYFFSKGEPKSGAPSPLPPGYEVGVNDRTGLPYLRRSADADIPTVSDNDPNAGLPRKRVRVLRVRAASREEAEAKMAAEGRNVIASVPIDIEERFDQ